MPTLPNKEIEYAFDGVWKGDIEDDTFDRATKVHDWRNHVPNILRASWTDLSRRERMIVAITADMAADIEEWD